MAHMLFGERFYSYREEPWHRLGIVSDVPRSAEEAYADLDYQVTLEPLQTVGTEEEGGAPPLTLSDRVIIRHPTLDDPEFRNFGVVGSEYVLVTPREAVRIWDHAVKKPVETLGVLGTGQTMFMSTILPDLTLNGEEMRTYLIFVNPVVSGDAAEAMVSIERPVCHNTLTAARSLATESYVIRHDRNVVKAMETWLSGIVERAEAKLPVLKEAFDILGKAKMKGDAVDFALEQIYPIPPKPIKKAPDDVMVTRMGYWEDNQKVALRFRGAVKELFDGQATGFNEKKFPGTAWGLYNSVVEWEDWRDGRGNFTRQAQSAVFGDRAKVKERAFDVLLNLARN